MIDPFVLPLSETVSVSKSAAKIAEAAASDVSEPRAGGLTFLNAVSQAGMSAITDLRQAEDVSMNALRGNAGPREVAEAVMEAEKSLQIAIAVRDKIVTAYMEISRMAI